MWFTVVADGAEVPEPKETILYEEPVTIADGDRRKDHGQGSAHDDECPDEGLKERPVRPLRAQQLVGLRADGRHAALSEAALSLSLAVALRLCSSAGLALYRGGAQAGGGGFAITGLLRLR